MVAASLTLNNEFCIDHLKDGETVYLVEVVCLRARNSISKKTHYAHCLRKERGQIYVRFIDTVGEHRIGDYELVVTTNPDV